MTSSVKNIPREKLGISSGNTRLMDYDKDILESLERGGSLRIPLCVYWNEEKKLYLIYDGLRRFNAGLKYGLTEFPCIIVSNITNEVEALLACIKHNDTTIPHSPFEKAYGVKQLLHEYKKTMDSEEARSKIRDQCGFDPSKLSKLESIASIDPDLIISLSHCESARERLSQKLLYRISKLPIPVQKEMAREKWNDIKRLRDVVGVFRDNQKELSRFKPKAQIHFATAATEKGLSPQRITNFLVTQLGTKERKKKVQSLEDEAVAEVEEAGNKVPDEMMTTRDWTLGPMLDYWWQTLDVIAQDLGYDTPEQYVLEKFLKPQAADAQRILYEHENMRLNKLSKSYKTRLKELRRERSTLLRRLGKVEAQIQELEDELDVRLVK